MYLYDYIPNQSKHHFKLKLTFDEFCTFYVNWFSCSSGGQESIQCKRRGGSCNLVFDLVGSVFDVVASPGIDKGQGEQEDGENKKILHLELKRNNFFKIDKLIS